MIVNHAPGNALAGFAALGYHDPVYDETGGQGTAVDLTSSDPQQNPGVLLMIAIVILVVMMAGDE